ncbi:redoxin domain-containing protein [Cochleicola gelatinilyticus]|uniref:Alkyl hydroperoxide reductase n=1 Tax=Cochleicola gelatinilyticus TaxID=1763537 RepID=A0A167JD89_9FLAO|nr:redoxin domain-containing protein [Cochleicola gelatinilyticus]OAB80558.1 alkyl hydroperoxide reductase [Cochleicola gelatinilyticus]
MIQPKNKVPSLQVDLINGTKWELAKQDPKNFTLLIFYRGLHCPVCKSYLEKLTTLLDDYSERGVNVLALSMDTEKRAKISAEKWDIETLPLAYGISEATAREWGLYISEAIKDAEPDVFSEPGLFLIKKDGSLYCSSIQTMPFARPDLEKFLKSIDFVLEESYPARGTK